MADYTGRDQRLQYLFRNGGGGGATCLYDAVKINGIDANVMSLLSSLAVANAGIAEIIDILSGGGGGGGSEWSEPPITEKMYGISHWTEVNE